MTTHLSFRRLLGRPGLAALVVGCTMVPAVAVAAPASSPALTSTPTGAAARSAAPVAANMPSGPWRWSHYMAQKVTWSSATCSADVQSVVSQIGGMTPGMVVECARVKAALDWHDTSKGNITLQITRSRRIRPAGDTRATRTLFVNPGGPGVAADFMAPAVTYLEPSVAAVAQVIAVDPRGTGGSTPLACTTYTDGVADYRLRRQVDVNASNAALKKTVNACVAKNGTYLRQINTFNTVNDMNMVRALLKVDKVDYLGVSAGTWLGSHWAQQFPSTVGRFVLDSNLNFTASWRSAFALQPKGFQRRFDRQFLPWLARNNATYGLGSGVKSTRAHYEQLRTWAAAGRLRGITPNTIDNVIATKLYSDEDFPALADQLQSWWMAAKSAKTSTRLPGPSSRVSAEDTVFMAIPCNDDAWTKNLNSYSREGLALGKAYPLLGYSWTTQACAFWPYRPTATAKPTGKGVPEMLMVQTELDPATPYEGARAADRATSNTRMLFVDNQGNHGAYLGRNSCVESKVSTFLTQGTLPAVNTVCGGLKLPGDSVVYPVKAATSLLKPIAARDSAARMTPQADALRAKIRQAGARAFLLNR